MRDRKVLVGAELLARGQVRRLAVAQALRAGAVAQRLPPVDVLDERAERELREGQAGAE